MIKIFCAAFLIAFSSITHAQSDNDEIQQKIDEFYQSTGKIAACRIQEDSVRNCLLALDQLLALKSDAIFVTKKFNRVIMSDRYKDVDESGEIEIHHVATVEEIKKFVLKQDDFFIRFSSANKFFWDKTRLYLSCDTRKISKAACLSGLDVILSFANSTDVFVGAKYFALDFTDRFSDPDLGGWADVKAGASEEEIKNFLIRIKEM